MSKGRVVLGFVVVALLGAVWAGSALSAEGRRGRRWDPERMRQRMLERVKESLGATDEEWEALAPQIEKVQTLTTQIAGGRMAGLMRRRTAEGQEAEKTDLQKTTDELQAAAGDDETKPAEIKEKLAALREAREKAEKELADEQEKLLKLVDVRQEAQLVLLGLLK